MTSVRAPSTSSKRGEVAALRRDPDPAPTPWLARVGLAVALVGLLLGFQALLLGGEARGEGSTATALERAPTPTATVQLDDDADRPQVRRLDLGDGEESPGPTDEEAEKEDVKPRYARPALHLPPTRASWATWRAGPSVRSFEGVTPWRCLRDHAPGAPRGPPTVENVS